ncbi:hypothetical protein BC827DRAFT_547752 [Russula dissimulans]|nr:hypothetical protein BC827DRAFT_547752 [Russula dissimulans]
MALPQTVLGKRSRGADDALEERGLETNNSQRQSSRKKEKVTTTRFSGTAGPTNRTPAVRTQTAKNRKSKALRCGAGRLAALSAQEVSGRSPQGPSVQQVSAGTIAQEKLPRIEGSVEGEMLYAIDSTVPRKETGCYIEESKPEEAPSTLFYIPRQPDLRHKALLEATSDDWARGTIRVLKCRLCPHAGFSNWGLFTRHCDTMEAHPASFSFCDHCGDFFARSDSLERHYKSHPAECRDVSPVMAEIKRRETTRVHREFEERLHRCLKSDEEVGRPFAQIIRAMYPNSSKRGSRQQNRL